MTGTVIYMLDILFAVVVSSHSVIPLAGGSKDTQSKSGLTNGYVLSMGKSR